MSADLINKVQNAFSQVLGYAPSHIIQAPGRVNLIGEHTDYNDGFVLPSAINYQAVVAAKPRSDKQVNVISVDYDNAQDSFSIAEPIVATEQDWANYIRGVVKHLQLRGYELTAQILR